MVISKVILRYRGSGHISAERDCHVAARLPCVSTNPETWWFLMRLLLIRFALCFRLAGLTALSAELRLLYDMFWQATTGMARAVFDLRMAKR
jgi:hypothetical protein